MSFELSGKIIEKFDTEKISDSFRKREFVVEKKKTVGSSEFVDMIKFQLTQDRCDILDNYNQDDEIKISFNIRGRKWEKEGRVSYFTNLEAWRIEKISAEESQDQPPPPVPPDDALFEDGGSDDLPF